mmetsp:Transcript_25095/g.36909  ORF Transcript_25095/g.36909 Transcript_25095/m.36909 type:complete len:116 (-) Transcript_25095:2904-3251(-)
MRHSALVQVVTIARRVRIHEIQLASECESAKMCPQADGDFLQRVRHGLHVQLAHEGSGCCSGSFPRETQASNSKARLSADKVRLAAALMYITIDRQAGCCSDASDDSICVAGHNQ